MVTEVQTCFRHDDRRAGVRCQRCERPICPECMHQASVGFHCPECVRAGRQQVVTARQLRQGPPASAFPVTVALIAVNVAVFAATALERGLLEPAQKALLDYSLVGSLRVGTPPFGAVDVIGVAEGEWYRLVTGGFLHAGLLHLGMNMLVLWMLGRQLEPAAGRIGFATVYVTSLLGGSLGVMVAEPHALTVGASGAVFGLFGYAVAWQLSRGVNPMQTGLGGVVLVNLLFTVAVPGISIGGHVGGLLGGLAAGGLVELARRLRLPTPVGSALVAGLGGVFFLAAAQVAA